MSTDDQPRENPPPIPEFPPSLLRAAEHLKAKFLGLPWFISVNPALHEGRLCLMLYVKDQGVPRDMVLPTSFETFKVIIDKVQSAAARRPAEEEEPGAVVVGREKDSNRESNPCRVQLGAPRPPPPVAASCEGEVHSI